MAKLGSRERPAIVRVQSQEKAQEIFEICIENGWQVIVGIEPDKKEDVSDVETLLHPKEPLVIPNKKGRNELCDCGSGKKYKKCCLSY